MAKTQEKQAKTQTKAPSGGKTGSGMGIKVKMIIGILPAVFISLIAMALIMVSNSRSIMHSETQEEMEAMLKAQSNSVDGDLDTVRLTCTNLARAVAATYKTTSMEQYAQVFGNAVQDCELASGAGVWFEPNVYNGEKYCGPYWYADGDKIVEDWEYSNADYDYLSQEYYTNAKAMKEMKAVITDPYYDESSKTVMASCSAPILVDGKFIGCVTTDITLATVAEELDGVKVGENGFIILTDTKGVLIYDPHDTEAAANGVNISEKISVGSEVVAQDTGISTYKADGQENNIYWMSIPEQGWKVALVIPLSEINAPVNKMIRISVIITILALLVSVLVIYIQADSVAKSMKKVRTFAEKLAGGDFTVEKIDVRRKDEIGQMALSLNDMYENNSNVIRNISVGSTKVNSSSNELDSVADHLSDRFGNIQDSMVRVNDAMTNTGAATQQVSASANEVNASVQKLADETAKTAQEVERIKERARKIQNHSKQSSDNAIKVANQRGAELKAASEQAKVVSEIGTLADSIADIASEINLLSLNATIEAARAGEHGKGFAVVASEINNLATETKTAVDQIQETIDKIQDAFTSLDRSAGELLTFVQDTVGPDYENFIEVGKQYGDDANSFGQLAEAISEMVAYIKESMDQVNAAVASIAESATETATSSAEVTDTVNEVSDMVDEVSDMAQDQKSVSNNLSGIVKQFKLSE